MKKWPRARAFSVRKEPGVSNDDAWRYNTQRRRLVVSDGASVSFAPRRWAKILTRQFLLKPELTASWLQEAAAEFSGKHDRRALPWSAQASFDRGTFATLVGLRYSARERQVHVWGVGDTLAVLYIDGAIEETFPYTSADEFRGQPRLLSTIHPHNAFISDAPERFTTVWKLPTDGSWSILVVTDALGHWLLSQRDDHHGEQAVRKLLDLQDRRAFVQFVKRERAAGRLRLDDTTLLRLN